MLMEQQQAERIIKALVSSWEDQHKAKVMDLSITKKDEKDNSINASIIPA